MEIILKQYVKGLGEKNDLVKVKDGYGRNFLIPQKLAVIATKEAKKVLQENLKQASHRQDHIRKEAEKVAEKIAASPIKVETLAGADGKLFGSITTLMVENVLKELGIEVDRKRITLIGEIKEVGTYSGTIDLHKEVKAKLTIEVVAKQK
jgi:large subunit ribosomal protein L9